MSIKLRNGVPTKSEIRRLADECSTHLIFQINHNYGKGRSSDYLHWQRSNMNDLVRVFMSHLIAQGIQCTDFSPYESPTVGSFRIIAATK